MGNIDNRIKLGERVRELHCRQNLPLRRFGMMTGLGHAYLSEIENGKREVRFDNLCRIAAALGVTVSELTDIGDPSRTASAPKE